MSYVLVSTVKNEAPYLWEWVAYHRMIGFDDIVIFENDSTDGTDLVLAEMARHGFVSYRKNVAKKGLHQIQAYRRATRQPQYLGADWVMALDLDEFLVIHAGDGTLDAFAAAVPAFECAHINWRLFGSSGFAQTPAGLVTENFVMCEREAWLKDKPQPYKCLFRRTSFDRPGIHKPVSLEADHGQLRRINGSGLVEGDFEIKGFQSTDPGLRKIAQINHYIVKDAMSFVLKNARGSAHQANREIDEVYWSGRNRNQAVDKRLANRAGALRGAMAEMDQISNGKLAAMTQAAQENHRTAFEAHIRTPRAKALLDFCLANLRSVPKRQPEAAALS